MSVIFDQRPESLAWSVAKNEGVVEYNLIGTAGEFPDEAAAAAYVYAVVPVFRNYAWIQDIQLKPQGPSFWHVSCPYGPLPKWPGSYEIHSRTTGGTVHISAANSMVAKHGTGAPDTVIIGQDGAGAEIVVPVQMRSYTFNFGRGIVTEFAMDYWESLVGLVNSATWHNRPAGEVLYLGHDCKTTISADPTSSVTFDFALSRNKTGITIGSISGIAKQGHDLIDIHTKTVVIAGQDVQQEKYVYIQRVYERANFFSIFGF